MYKLDENIAVRESSIVSIEIVGNLWLKIFVAECPGFFEIHGDKEALNEKLTWLTGVGGLQIA